MKKNKPKENQYLKDYKDLQKFANKNILSYKELSLIEKSIEHYLWHMSNVRDYVAGWEPYDINKNTSDYGFYHINIFCENLKLAKKKLYKIYEFQHSEINEICQSSKQTNSRKYSSPCETTKEEYCYS